jgi:hypothetical protein
LNQPQNSLGDLFPTIRRCARLSRASRIASDHSTVRKSPKTTLSELLQSIEAAALARTDNRLRDDIALLAVRCQNVEAMR